VTPGGVQEPPAYCLSGVRHKDGVSVIQAWVWNVGTCRLEAKGDTRVVAPHASEYRSGAQGRHTP
jgi:hypothetical protein